MEIIQVSSAVGSANSKAVPVQLAKVATEFEASFLSEMLKSAGFGDVRSSFGGGAGEGAFSSLLVREQATLLAKSGGVGLAEHILKSLLDEAADV